MRFAMIGSVSRERPWFAMPATLWCEITTGTPSSRPMRKVSRGFGDAVRSSRMWVQ
jgi:hypothetical protein